MSVLHDAKVWAVRQIDRGLAATQGRFPHYTEGGEWVTTPDGSWTGGLWVGELWVAHKWTGDHKYLDAAMGLLPRLEARIDRHDANFDLGFLLYPSFVGGFDLLGEDWLRVVALRGAQRMLDFCHKVTRLIYCIYPGRAVLYDRSVGSTIIDVMMNLSLLWWAGQETGNYKLDDIAQRHAECSERLHVRRDGSTFHLVDFDLDTGYILYRGTFHGLGDASTWARGQAWGIYGFSLAHLATGKEQFASAAERLSGHFLERLPPDGKAFWDLSDPMIPNAIRDTSASAISATRPRGKLPRRRRPPSWPRPHRTNGR